MVGERYSGSNDHFKRVMLAFLFILTFIRFVIIIFFPFKFVILDRTLLTLILLALSYLWLVEARSRRELIKLHKDLKESHEQLKQAEIDAIASLIKAEEEKDEYTRGHSERVRDVALAIADKMSLTPASKTIIDRAGMLHDIGKIGISDLILCKKKGLTKDEWDEIRTHPERADKILEPLKFLTAERDVIMSHHERYDGKGYPRGLKTKEIPVEALVLAVADSFDAMNSARYYRSSVAKDVIISEFKSLSGTKYSPEVVDALLKLLEDNPELWERKR